MAYRPPKPTTDPSIAPIEETEPVVLWTSIAGVVIAILIALKPELEGDVTNLVYDAVVVLGPLAVAAWRARSQVYSQATVKKLNG